MSNPLDQQLNTIEQVLTQLQSLLGDEETALVHHDAPRLATIAPQKLELCQALSRYDLAQLKQQITQLQSVAYRDKCEARHTLLVELARQVRDSNVVNGMVMNRTQQSVNDLIRILSGKPRNGLYGTTGQPVAGGDASQETIAQA